VRAKVEHVFRVLKCQFGYRKVRYRGIAKNGAQVIALLALANLYLARGRLVSA
jgi:IS5 family transposase